MTPLAAGTAISPGHSDCLGLSQPGETSYCDGNSLGFIPLCDGPFQTDVIVLKILASAPTDSLLLSALSIDPITGSWETLSDVATPGHDAKITIVDQGCPFSIIDGTAVGALAVWRMHDDIAS